jgi:hypothetical protein
MVVTRNDDSHRTSNKAKAKRLCRNHQSPIMVMPSPCLVPVAESIDKVCPGMVFNKTGSRSEERLPAPINHPERLRNS